MLFMFALSKALSASLEILFGSGLAHAEIIESTKVLDRFSGPSLFRDFEHIAEEAKIYLNAIAWFILCLAVSKKIQEGGFAHKPARTIANILLVMAAITFSNTLLNSGIGMADGLAKAVGSSRTKSLAEHVFNIYHTVEIASIKTDTNHNSQTKEGSTKSKKEEKPEDQGFIVGPIKKAFRDTVLSIGLTIVQGGLWLCSFSIST